MEKIKSSRKKFIAPTLIFLTLTVNLFFGFPRLTKYSAVDEHFWTYDRIPQFWSAVSRHRWKSTKINDKPGITVALISGAGLLRSDPLRYRDSLVQPKDAETVAEIKKITFNLRLPLYLFTLLMALAFYFLLKRLFNQSIALFSVVFIYLSPVILGISLFINPDSLLWCFIPISIISFLTFLKTGRARYSYLSGFFCGMSLLTKYVATILFFFFPLLIVLDCVFTEKNIRTKRLRKNLLEFGKFVFISLLTIFSLYPAVWVKSGLLWGTSFLSPPMETMLLFWLLLLGSLYADSFLLKNKLTQPILSFVDRYKKYFPKILAIVFILSIVTVILNVFSQMHFYDFEMALLSPKSGDHTRLSLLGSTLSYLTGFYALIFTLLPMVLVSFVFAIGKILKAKNINYRNNLLAVFFFLLFILIYYAGSAKNFIESTVRYQISVYPLAEIIAAVGLYEFMQMEKIKSLKKYFSITATSIIIIFFSSLSLFLIKPYYFAYTSSLLPKQYLANPKGMGDGMFQAATYLNALPEPQKISAWTDKVGFCKDFIGSCYTSLKDKNLPSDGIDYFVVSAGNAKKSIVFSLDRHLNSPGFSKMESFYYSDKFDTKKIEIDGRPKNFVKIIKNPDLQKK